ncbi:MAG: hypothetical protein FWB86_12985, partial [Treponema sp.]|nr:hypothetical protein [Treponema sp.]MCL2251450.1 hypothetical protein [Treponema sp.]
MSWQTSDGQNFSNESDAQSHQDSLNSGTSGSLGFNIIVSAILKVFFALPNVVAKIIGYPFVFFFKLWYLGRLL